MMRTLVRFVAMTAAAALLVAACGTAAAPTPVATPAATSLAPAPTAPPPDPTATPAPTPAASVGPMDAAYVTCTGSVGSSAGDATETTRGDLRYVEGETLAGGTGTCSDPRASGTLTARLSGVADAKGIGFEWGTFRIENAGGAWEGPFTGGVWAGLNASDLTAWLVGSGDYEGLTFYFHCRSTGLSTEGEGVILRAPPPATR